MGRTVFVSATLGALLIASMLACGSDDRRGIGCGDFVVPGVIIGRPGIALSLHNDLGQPIAQGSRAIFVDRPDSLPAQSPEDSPTLAVWVNAADRMVRAVVRLAVAPTDSC